jgi:hypothetical protein
MNPMVFNVVKEYLAVRLMKEGKETRLSFGSKASRETQLWGSDPAWANKIRPVSNSNQIRRQSSALLLLLLLLLLLSLKC